MLRWCKSECQLLLSIFITVLSLSLLILDESADLLLTTFPCSLSLFPPKFLWLFPSQIAMYYSSEVCCPFPESHSFSRSLSLLLRQ